MLKKCWTLKIKLGTIFIAGMFVLGTAILLFNVRKARACEPPCTLTCGIDSPNQTICDGGSATFTCTNSDGFPEYTYSWTGPNGFSANTAAITINPAHAADAGAYSCVVTDVNNCAAQGAGTLKVVGIKSLNPDSSPICVGSPTVTLTAIPVGDDNFPSDSPAWGNISYDPVCDECNFTAINGIATATFTPAANYAGTATISASCGTSSATTQIVVIGVVSLTNSPAGTDIGGGTNVYCVGNSGVTITVSATLTSTNNLPSCYSLTKNGSPLGQALSTTVDKSAPGITKVIAKAGTSTKTNIVAVLKVNTIKASCPKANNSPQFFQGHMSWPIDVTHSPADKSLVIFYKDVINSSFNVQDFNVTLKANILPTSITAHQLGVVWSKISGPNSGSFNNTDSFEIKYQNPKQGGVYRFVFDLNLNGCAKSEANVVLPLAGAEVDSIVGADVGRANTFAARVVSNYSWLARQSISNASRPFSRSLSIVSPSLIIAIKVFKASQRPFEVIIATRSAAVPILAPASAAFLRPSFRVIRRLSCFDKSEIFVLSIADSFSRFSIFFFALAFFVAQASASLLRALILLASACVSIINNS